MKSAELERGGMGVEGPWMCTKHCKSRGCQESAWDPHTRFSLRSQTTLWPPLSLQLSLALLGGKAISFEVELNSQDDQPELAVTLIAICNLKVHSLCFLFVPGGFPPASPSCPSQQGQYLNQKHCSAAGLSFFPASFQALRHLPWIRFSWEPSVASKRNPCVPTQEPLLSKVMRS